MVIIKPYHTYIYLFIIVTNIFTTIIVVTKVRTSGFNANPIHFVPKNPRIVQYNMVQEVVLIGVLLCSACTMCSHFILEGVSLINNSNKS